MQLGPVQEGNGEGWPGLGIVGSEPLRAPGGYTGDQEISAQSLLDGVVDFLGTGYGTHRVSAPSANHGRAPDSSVSSYPMCLPVFSTGRPLPAL